MKRPFALIGITYLSVQAALFYLESDLAAAILTAVCFIGTIVSLFILKNRNLRQQDCLHADNRGADEPSSDDLCLGH